MNPTKVIVQCIPYKFFSIVEDDSNRDLKKKSKVLKQIFSKFGPVNCTYLFSNSYERRDNFAHIVFADTQDALRAWKAGASHEIQINQEVLALTLVFEDEEPIKVLDDYCLLKIFSMLGQDDKLRVERVCKRWEKLALCSWVSQRSITFDSQHGNLEEIEKLAVRCGEYVNKVICIRPVNSSSLSLIGRHCKHVHEMLIFVDYSSTGKKDEDKFFKSLAVMLKNMSDLVKLRLAGIYKNFNFDFVQTLPTNMNEISFSAFPYNRESRVLISLDLTRFRNLTALELNHFVIDAGALKGLECLKNLVSLDLHDSSVHPSNMENLKHLTNLRYLILSECDIGDDILLSVVASHRELEVLCLKGIVSVTDRSIMAVSTLPKLKHLDLTNLSRVEFNFMDEMAELEILDCQNCGVGDVGLIKIVQTSQKLTFLNIMGCRVTHNFFIFANLAVKMRTNEVELMIFTSIDVNIKKEDISPLLRIIECKNHIIGQV